MNETMLTLKPDTELTEAGDRIGLMRNGQTQFAKNGRQAEILRALLLQSQPLEGLTALLRTGNGLQSDNENLLAIAEFILDFGEYLEA